MTQEQANNFRKQISDLEKRIDSERDKEKKRNLEKELNQLYKDILNSFGDNIEEKAVKSLDEQSILFSEFLGRYLVFLGLSTSQVRNFYGDVMRLRMKKFSLNDLIILKPRLAYLTERKGTEGSKKFREVIEKALDKVIFTKEKQNEYFENFANFFEAILAYHRSFGGK